MGKTRNQINVKLTNEQKEIVDKLVGVMGGTEAEVVRNIFLAWLSDKSVLTEVIKKTWLESRAK
jgi:hypothetical protein